MVHTNLTQEQLDSIAALRKQRKPPFQATAQRLNDVTEAINNLATAMTEYNEAQATYVAHHWTGIPVPSAPYGTRCRDKLDSDNTQALYPKANSVLTAWKELKATMRLAIQRHSFGHTTVLLRPQKK